MKVEPIKHRKDIIKWKEYVKSNYSLQHYVFLVMALNCPNQSKDLIDLNWVEIEKAKKNNNCIPERRLKLYQTSLKALKMLREEFPDDIWVFQSRAQRNLNNHWNLRHISNFMKDSAKKCGLKERVGGDTPRKTYGLHAYYSGINIAQICRMFEHSSIKYTLEFLCIDTDPSQFKDTYDLAL